MVSTPQISRRRRSAVALLAVMFFAALVAPSAVAVPSTLPPPAGPPATPPTTGEETWNPNPHYPTKRSTVREGSVSCHVVSSASFIGASCVDVNGTGGVELTIKDILAGDPLPDCWDDPLNERELKGLNLANGDEWVWYWQRCLEGIDKKTLEIEPGGVVVWTGLHLYKKKPGPGDYKIVELTNNQVKLVDKYADDGIVPSPVLGVSPSPLPLVNQDISFYNYGQDSLTVNVPEVNMQMRGRIEKMTVLPEGRNGPTVSCDGTGYEAKPGQERKDHPQGCWYTFTESSIGLDDDVYKAEVHTHWVIEVRLGNGPWKRFNQFTKGAFYNLSVNEVQALVVP